jgi:hypothetical protein
MIQDIDTVHVPYVVHDIAAVARSNPTRRGLRLLTNYEPAFQFGSTIVVERTGPDSADHGTCALCWTGPGPLAGSVRRDTANPVEFRAICSRCLVTLEMLAVQFGFQLRLQVETPA